MKNILITLLLIVAVKGMAQTTTHKKVRVGFQFTADVNKKPEYIGYGAGWNMIKTKSLNYTAGVLTQFRVAKNFELGSGLLYSNKDVYGSFNCPNCDMIGWSVQLKQRYLEVPVTARLIIPGKSIGFYTEAGFITSASVTNDYDESIVGNQMNRFMFGGQVGLGGIFSLRRFDFSLGGSFRRSFTDTYKGDRNNYKLTSIGVTAAAYYRL